MPLRCSVFKMTLFQWISKPVGAMPRITIVPPVFIVSMMSRKHRRARRFEADVETFLHTFLVHDVAQLPFEASTT